MKLTSSRLAIYYASVLFWTSCSLFLIGYGLVWPRLDFNQVAVAESLIRVPTSTTHTPDQEIKSGHPKQILIPRLGIDLQVIEGTYFPANQTWTLSDDKVQFSTMSSPPNNHGGTTFLYGHNTPAVFKRLHELDGRDEVIIKTNEGLTFTYQLTNSYRVRPQQTQVLNSANEPTLLLLTCSGIWNEWRSVFELRLVRVN